IGKYFGSLQRRGSRLSSDIPAPNGPELPLRREIADPAAPPRITFAWVGAPAYHAGDAELQVLAAMLGVGQSSLLHRSLVLQKKPATRVECSVLRLAAGSAFTCDITPREGASPEAIERVFDGVIEDIIAGRVATDDVERAKTVTKAELVRKLETFLDRAELI